MSGLSCGKEDQGKDQLHRIGPEPNVAEIEQRRPYLPPDSHSVHIPLMQERISPHTPLDRGIITTPLYQ